MNRIWNAMLVENARIVRHAELSRHYRQLTIAAAHIASHVRPGQFVTIRLPMLHDAVLRRPFSVFKADHGALTIIYRAVGRGTRVMTQLRRGDELSVMGPLGHGFPTRLGATAFPVLVAGGYGVAPLYLLAKALPHPGVLFVGGAGKADVLCLRDFKQMAWPAHVATEDGSMGDRGLVTEVLDRWLAAKPATVKPVFFACGPHGMLKAVGERAIRGGWKAWLSLDRHMACGVGACLACVQRVRRDGEETWARACTDGPVFEAREIVWDDNGPTLDGAGAKA
jgi:dihydroorotate dehydrogenase electron transfer subunit